MNNVKQMLQAHGWQTNGKLLAHWMNWFGDSHYHPMTAYTSYNPVTIGRQLDVMQASGIDGVIVTWQGTNNPSGQQATLEMLSQIEDRSMLFCLLADPWLMGNKAPGEQEVIAQLTSQAGLSMIQSPAYLPEGYFLDFTNDLFNQATVTAALKTYLPAFNVLSRHTQYSWPEIVNTIPTLKSDNANSTMKIPGLFYKFFDGGNPNNSSQFSNPARGEGAGIDDNTETWDAPTDEILNDSRTLEDQAGNLFFDALAVTPMTSNYLALVTWNDYNERTAWEPFLSMVAGERIY
jgi:hypothetical protein